MEQWHFDILTLPEGGEAWKRQRMVSSCFRKACGGKSTVRWSMLVYTDENVIMQKQGNGDLMWLISLLNQFFMPLYETLSPKLKEQVKNGEIANPITLCCCPFLYICSLLYFQWDWPYVSGYSLFPTKSGFSITTIAPSFTSAFQCIWCMHSWEFDLPKETFSLCSRFQRR